MKPFNPQASLRIDYAKQRAERGRFVWRFLLRLFEWLGMGGKL